MKLILQAIKSLFRKVYAKLAAMEADTNGKLEELRKTVEALTPMVVHITNDSNFNPVIDKTLTEIMLHIKNGGRVEFVLNGSFMLENMDVAASNITLQVAKWNEDGSVIAAGVDAVSTQINTWTIGLTSISLSIVMSHFASDDSIANIYNGDYA